MLQGNYSTSEQKVQAVLTEYSKRKGKSSGFVERNSKMDGAVFVQTLVLGCMQKAEMSLNELSKTSRKLGVSISGAGLDQRIDGEAVVLMQEVLQESLQHLNGQERLEIALLARFSAVYLTDSTQMELPAAMAECFPGSGGHASPAAIKLQVMFEYLTSSFRAIELGPANQPDQNCRMHLTHSQTGALHLFDLGYFNQRVLDSIHRWASLFHHPPGSSGCPVRRGKPIRPLTTAAAFT